MNIIFRAYLISALLVALILGGGLLFLNSASAGDTAATSVTVSNATPSVTSVALNGGSAISLTENTTTSVSIAATITDTNNCDDVFTSGTITAVLFRSGVTASSGCSNDARNCYPSITMVEVGNSCNGSTDTSGDAVATSGVWYFADATDTSSTYPGNVWIVAVTATDGSSASASSTASVELNSLYALEMTGTLVYGSLAAGASSTADAVATSTNTGNFKIDNEISGTDMTASGFTLVATEQRYGTSSATHPNLTFQLTTSATARSLNVPVAVTSTNPTSTVGTFWRINIPNGSRTGAYTGTNTFTAIYSAD